MQHQTLAKKNFSQYFYENRSLFFSFLFPFVILAAAFFSRAVFPIGDRNILTIDLYHQYAPFVVELREKLTSFSSLFYTWNGGLGTNFWSLFAYYLASPLNILIVLFPPAYLTEAILLLVLVKIGLSGATFWRSRTVPSFRIRATRVPGRFDASAQAVKKASARSTASTTPS